MLRIPPIGIRIGPALRRLSGHAWIIGLPRSGADAIRKGTFRNVQVDGGGNPGKPLISCAFGHGTPLAEEVASGGGSFRQPNNY